MRATRGASTGSTPRFVVPAGSAFRALCHCRLPPAGLVVPFRLIQIGNAVRGSPAVVRPPRPPRRKSRHACSVGVERHRWQGVTTVDLGAGQRMVPTSPTAQAVARRLLAPALTQPASGSASENALQRTATVDRIGHALADALSRAFGPHGYHALLGRALAQTRSGHPALALVSVRSALEPRLCGLEDAAEAHGADALVEGLVGVIAVLTDLLGRLIGEDMAVILISRAAPPASADTRDAEVSTDRPGDPGTAP